MSAAPPNAISAPPRAAMEEDPRPPGDDGRRFRRLTSRWRTLPDFLIIGAMKCGTTSLYYYLTRHRGVAPVERKELHFFDRGYHRGIEWYKSHFLLRGEKFYRRHLRRRRWLAGEATPLYLFHPLAPERIKRTLPEAKLIVLLRNPVDRAYSHYQHQVRAGKERLSFAEAIEREPERLRGEIEKMRADGSYDGVSYRRFSYLARGRYAEQLRVWFGLFAREQMLVLNSEELFQNPSQTVARTLEFLKLPAKQSRRYPTYNEGRYARMDAKMRQQLIEYFRPHNQALYDLLGKDFGWDR
jgi:hypothetical protein